MTQRDPSSGGLTGATGDLTPDESAGDFEPGELREQQTGEVTRHHAHGQARHEPVDPDRPPTAGGDNVEEREDRF
jgi:hypothetical protein